ncbi:MAG TPA: hypothetical protein VGE74_09965 [Gemmata sp.]
MEQKFDATPRAELRLDGRKVTRTDVTGDWGLQLRWVVKRDGKVIATPPARAEHTYEHPGTAPGAYEIVLEQFKYVNYQKDATGEYTKSAFVAISNAVTYTI